MKVLVDILLPEDPLITEIPGRFSENLDELLGKIADGIKTNDGRNLFDLQAGVLQKTGGLHTAFPVEKADEGHTHFLAELVG